MDAIDANRNAEAGGSFRRQRCGPHRWSDLESVVPDQQDDLDEFLRPVHCRLCPVFLRTLLLGSGRAGLEAVGHSVPDFWRKSPGNLLPCKLGRISTLCSSHPRNINQTAALHQIFRVHDQRSLSRVARLEHLLCAGFFCGRVGDVPQTDLHQSMSR